MHSGSSVKELSGLTSSRGFLNNTSQCKLLVLERNQETKDFELSFGEECLINNWYLFFIFRCKYYRSKWGYGNCLPHNLWGKQSHSSLEEVCMSRNKCKVCQGNCLFSLLEPTLGLLDFEGHGSSASFFHYISIFNFVAIVLLHHSRQKQLWSETDLDSSTTRIEI